jgi:putative transposase
MRIRQLNHSVYQIRYHIVWGTKYRYKVLKSYVRTELIGLWFNLLKTKYPTWYIHEINAGDDHIHMMVELPPNERISDFVQKMKAYASIYLKHKFKFIAKIYYQGHIWSVGYFVSTVGLNEEQIRKYIQRQNQFDLGIDVTQEFS